MPIITNRDMDLNMWYRKAVSLALLPMIAQTTLFLSWCFTYSSLLVHLTSSLIVGTVLCLGYGLTCLRSFSQQAFMISSSIPLLRRKVFIACFLFFMNIPIAGLYAYWMYNTRATHTIRFINHGPFPMEEIRLANAQGEQWDITSIPADQVRTVRLPFSKHESVFYRLRMGDRIETGCLFEYPDSMANRETTITLDKTGEFVIRLPKTKKNFF